MATITTYVFEGVERGGADFCVIPSGGPKVGLSFSVGDAVRRTRAIRGEVVRFYRRRKTSGDGTGLTTIYTRRVAMGVVQFKKGASG